MCTDLTPGLRDGVGETVAEWVGGTTPGTAGQLEVSSWQTEVGGSLLLPTLPLLLSFLHFDVQTVL